MEEFNKILSVILVVCLIGIGIMAIVGLLYLLCWFPEICMVVFVILTVIYAGVVVCKS